MALGRNANHLDRQEVEAIRSSAQALLAQFPEVWRAGREFRARCLLHDDQAPSLTVYQHKDGAWMWHCFPCGTGGDVFSLLKKLGLSFPDSLRRLQDQGQEVNFSKDPYEGKPAGKQREGEKGPTHALLCEMPGCLGRRDVTLLEVAMLLDAGEVVRAADGELRWLCRPCVRQLRRDRRWLALYGLLAAPRPARVVRHVATRRKAA